MLRNKLLLLIALFSLLYSVKANDQLKALFIEGNTAYHNKAYLKADSLYSMIEAQGFYSTELFYNLGNTNYKLDRIPETIFYFEKALKLSPGNEEIIHNLKLANQKIADKNTIKTSSRIEDVIYTYIKTSTNLWAKTSIVVMFISGGLFILFIFVQQLKTKKIAFYSAIGCFIVGLVTIYLSALQHKKLTSEEYGIVFAPSVELKMEPSDNSSTAFILHEGTKVKLLNQNEAWHEISFDKGQIAWIKKEALKTF
ncbi:MAG: hypothetical protein N4A35_05600 [Flavobacteriales bacterium]|jgi:tetratricopeptide (TPR) repeat protein|nr:hypothetical protein [Flavobacteriales bacterium]